MVTLTDDQRELLEDKFLLWDRASREGSMDLRDYNRRAADALKAALGICADAPRLQALVQRFIQHRESGERYAYPPGALEELYAISLALFPTSAEPGDRAERVGERSVHADQNPSPPCDPQ